MEKVKLGILIPVFNGLEFTKKCLVDLDTLKKHASLNDEQAPVVVIDDGSTDGTHEYIKSNHPNIHVLKGDGGLWWTGGINKGLDFALNELQCNYILWWNNDIEPKDDYLTKILEKIQETDTNTILGSKIFDKNKNRIWGMGGYFNPRTGAKAMYRDGNPEDALYQSPLEVDWLPGMGSVFHKSVFEKVGMLDYERFPQYHGDSDFTYRAKLNGFKIIAYPDLLLWNDTTNTGLKHGEKLSNLIKSMKTIKSNYNFKKDMIFFKLYAQSPLAYRWIFSKYFRYIAGFLKWRMLSVVGMKRKQTL